MLERKLQEDMMEILESKPGTYGIELRTNKDCESLAMSMGCRVVFSDPSTLLVDLDTEEEYSRFLRMIDKLSEHFPVKYCTVIASRSGLPCRHATVTLQGEYSQTERIAMQAILGSDPVRELLALKRDEMGDTTACIFFEKRY